jgi:hypothetical protein
VIPGTRTAEGDLLIDTNAPGAGRPFSGGFALNPVTGAIFVMNGTGNRFIGGHMATNAGQLCIAPGGVRAGWLNGLPVTVDGRLVTQLNEPVDPDDAFVGGIRVGPLGGVYTTDVNPPAPQGFSNGFDTGFGV